MGWCLLKMQGKKSSIMFRLFQSLSDQPGHWKMTGISIRNVQEKLDCYIVKDGKGNTELVYKGCEEKTEQTEEAIKAWAKEVEEDIPAAEVTCISMNDFVSYTWFVEKKFPFCQWRILKMTDEQGMATFKLFRSFSGGYNDWELNSGITKIDETPDSYIVQGVSGSEYEVAKKNESDSKTLVGFLSSVRKRFLRAGMNKATVEVVGIADYQESEKDETCSSRRHSRSPGQAG